MEIDDKAIRRAMMVAKSIAASVDPSFGRTILPTPRQGVPLMRSVGGQTEQENVKLDFTPADENAKDAVLPKLPKGTMVENYRRHAELVPMRWLLSLEHQNPFDEKKVQEVTNDLSRNGLREPLQIAFGTESRGAVLSEGNHRLEAARRLGYTHMPAIVVKQQQYPKSGYLFKDNRSVDEDLIPAKGAYHPQVSKPSNTFKSLAVPSQDVPLSRAKGGQVETIEGPEREQNFAEFMRGAHPDMFDDRGAPRRFYHGTSTSNIEKFKGHRGVAGHFSFEPKLANEWAKAHGEKEQEILESGGEDLGDAAQVYAVHLNVKNPFDARNPAHLAKIGKPNTNMKDWATLEENLPEIKKAGFDSFYDWEYSNRDPDGIAVFHPHQIKSAVGNSGHFDPENPDITKAEGGEVDAPQGYTPQPPGTLETDNPGGEWLEDQKAYSASRGYRPSGAPMSFGKVTAVWSDRKENEMAPVYLPVSMLKQIPGVMNEQQNVREHSLSGLVEHMGKTGRLPKFSEESTREYHPFITVDQRGMPFVNEGNHRIMAADRLGWKWLPVEVRYFNGGEDVDGPLHPDRIRAMHGVEPAKKAKGGQVETVEGLERAQNLKDWLGNSFLHVDGVPKTYYHGTSKDTPFTSFKVGRHGAWFASDPAEASMYATQNDSMSSRYEGRDLVKRNTASRVMPVYLKASNPYMGEFPEKYKNVDNYKKANSDWFDELRAAGYDSWVPRSQEGNLAVMLEGPHQVKSAVGNDGTFDHPTDITKAYGGDVDVKAPIIDPAKAIRRALMAAKSIGGSNSESDQVENTPAHSETRAETGGLPQSGGVRRGSGVLQASVQADPTAPLAGLPTDIKIPKTGETIKAGPNNLIRQVAADYMQSIGREYRPASVYAKVDKPRATRIAKAYRDMKHDPNDPLVKAAYSQLVKETMAQYQAAKDAGFKAEFWNPEVEEDPYGVSPRLAIEDVNKNNHMFVFPTRHGFGSDEEMAAQLHDNPLLADSGERWNGQPVTYNDIFRAVHDYFGHSKEGVGFRADGEENAWRSHAAMYSPLARLAMTSETRGQNSEVNYGLHGEKNRTARTEDTHFADQKIGVLPPWVMHEGAEDFLHPDEVLETYKIYNRKWRGDGGGLMEDQPAKTVENPDLFDMSMLHETPKVAQFDLPRYMPPRGVPERVADVVKSRKVANKLADVIQSGLDMGGARWYNAEPLRQEFVKYHGQDTGNRMFRKYMDMVAATSPRSEVGANVRNASYYFQRLASGQPVPEVGEQNPQPYGHLAQRLHQMNAQRVAGAGWDPLVNPKPASFAENLTGNQAPVTVDTHAFRLPAILAADPRFLETAYASSKESPKQNIRQMVESGELSLKDALKTPAYWNAAPKETEYHAMEQLYKKTAQKMGITPAAAQAAAWVGGGKLTGLASDESKPFMRFFQDRIYKTARAKNMDPQDVLQKFVKGEMSMYSDGGAVDAALDIAKKARNG